MAVCAPVMLAPTWAGAVEARRDEPFLVFEGPSGEVAEWIVLVDGLPRTIVGRIRTFILREQAEEGTR